jgi:hypothetical protein
MVQTLQQAQTQQLRASFKLLPKQLQLVQALEDPSVEIVLAVGAQQSGKTVGAAAAYLQHVARHPFEFFVLGGPTLRNVKEASLRKFNEACRNFQGFKVSENKIEQRIDLWNGSVIYYHTYDQGVKAWEGFTAKAAWIDDAQQMPLEIYHELGFRLAVKRGKLLITARVPDPSQLRQHWLYGLYRQALLDPSGPIRYIKFTAWDNPYYPAALIEEKRRKLLPEQFQAWVEGRMDLTYCDDHIFNPEEISKAMKRFTRAFSQLPPELQDFVRKRQMSPAPHPEEQIPEDATEFQFLANEKLIDIGIDVAGFGGNFNVVSYCLGNVIFACENWGPGEVTQIAEHLAAVGKQLMDLGYWVRFWPDATGIGASLPMLLAEKGFEAIGVKYGEKATESKTYFNKKAEAYFLLREKLPQLALPPVLDLKRQMEEQRYTERVLDGKIAIVEQKPSPDHLDSLVMSCMNLEASTLPLYVF